MAFWLMKSEPDVFSWDDLVAKGEAEWDGVRNHQAQANMRAMAVGDQALFYHSNIGLAVVGIMAITRIAAPDTTDPSGKWQAVLVAPVSPLQRAVTLKEIKADPHLAEMAMLRQSRLSVSPVTAAEFAHIVQLGES